MSIASYFNTDFVRVQLVGVTDVQSIIDEINTILTSTLPVDSRWTNLGSGQYRCAAQDPAGANRFFSVQVVRISATRLQWVVYDQNGSAVVDGRIDISATGSTVRIWAGNYHLGVDGGELAYGMLLDMEPFDGTSWNSYVVAYTRRDSLGSPRSEATSMYCIMLDGYGGAPVQRRIVPFNCAHRFTPIYAQTDYGSRIVVPAQIQMRVGGGSDRWGGNMYQAVVTDGNMPNYAEIEIPLADGVVGIFELTSLPGIFSDNLNTMTVTGNLAIRKA